MQVTSFRRFSALPAALGQAVRRGKVCDVDADHRLAQAAGRLGDHRDVVEVLRSLHHGLGEAMVGINVADLPAPHRLAERGW